jgi:hypothetical protein
MVRELVVAPNVWQQRLIDAIASIFLEHRKWAYWAWVDETLEREGLDASAVLASMPHEPVHRYGWLSPSPTTVVRPDFQFRLTVAGFSHVDGAQDLVAKQVALISALGEVRARTRLDPFSTEPPTVTSREVAGTLAAQLRRAPEPLERDDLEFLKREPSTWHCEVVNGSGTDWSIQLSAVVRRFAGVGSVEDYLDRLGQVLMAEAGGTPQAEFSSPFSLAAAFDYLDAVWQLKFQKPLVGPPGLERSARLVLGTATVEETDSALSALAEVLKALKVPGVPGLDGHPLQRLAPYLESVLPGEAMPRVKDAVAVFDAARKVRASAQHVGAQAAGITALQDLGLRYPVVDWPSAWKQIQRAVAAACDVVREELHATLG